MKVIFAYVQPFMLEKVTDALRAKNIHGVTVLQCQGFGRRIDGRIPHYEDPSVELGFAPKVKIELICQDDETLDIVRIIRESAHTGRPGDGMVYVTDIMQAVDIRTGTEGEGIL